MVQPAKCWNTRASDGTRPRCHTLFIGCEIVGSDNPISAGNQQERPGLEQWVVGFVDGEGCFSISVVPNATCRLGWQVQHEFSVSQAAPSRAALDLVRGVIGCGTIIENSRNDDHRHPLLRLSVKGRSDLRERVIPFFEANPLITAKRSDFEAFATVIRWMDDDEHLTEPGLRRIAQVTETMNRRARSRYLESSETIRRPPHLDG